MNEKCAVLLVDDDEDLLLLMSIRLRTERYKVEISPNCENIIDVMKKFQPDIILLDIRMNGIDGASVCKLLKGNQSTHGILIYMLSGNDDIKEVSEKCGSDGYISKPFSIEKINSIFEKIQ
ncbi:response regulator [Ferruginibacter albus]|uniref:response regulator n=1 Tax=Ferruginibacter albus TaxID=2875540 RepID=UPI001CC7F7CC|nr:response regulator [Ferruginibacter albus]UAY52844.1 response regulator [Ferruginibacter albus]